MWRLGLLLFTTVLGGLMGWGASYVRSSSKFVEWEQLDSPPGRVTDIFGRSFNVLLARTAEGDVYEYEFGRWSKVELPPDFVERSDYHCIDVEPPPPPGQIIAQYADSYECMETRNQQFYVLLADHTIWVWSYTASLFNVLLPYYLVPLGLIVGLIVGITFLLGEWVYSVWRPVRSN